MKPIFLIGATILAAGAAYSFALVVDRQELPQSLIQPDRGLAVERMTTPSRQNSEPQARQPALTPDSDNTRELTVVPVAPQIPSGTAEANAQVPAPEMPGPTATEQVATLDHTGLQNRPVLYFVAPDAQNTPPGSPGAFSAVENPVPAATERFEKLPFIGVYR